MRCSVFTPTHDGRYLDDCYRSLRDQTFSSWEWVVLPNGPDPPGPPLGAADDPRVRFLPAATSRGIGALKRRCCDAATGDLLVELDHDDVLAPTALADVAAAMARVPDGFYYSDFVQVTNTGQSRPGEADWDGWRQSGWERFPVAWQGETIWGLRAFDPCPRSLATVGTAPNHVRAWSRSAYERSGGHDAALAVCDDVDLIQRTYLTGAPFVHVPGALYAYREHDNTYKKRQDQIHALDVKMRDRLPDLRAEWCRRRRLAMLDLGSGTATPPGFLSLDRRGRPAVLADFSRSIPFADDSIGCLRAYDSLEHVPQELVPALWNEVHRVLAPGGWLVVQVPSTDGRGAWCDPTHRSYWNAASWRYVTDPRFAAYVPEITARFAVWSASDTDRDPWGVVWSRAELIACKGQRVPGGNPWS